MSPSTLIGKTRYRTWTVFSVALCSLLGLMVLPTFNALARGRQIYEQIRAMQQGQERSHRLLDSISSDLNGISILIREFLLDGTAETGRNYPGQFTALRTEVQSRIALLEQTRDSRNAAAVRRLRDVTESYWRSVDPIFGWTPAERAERGSYFLRQEQRPRRESILAITDEIRLVNEAFYRKQYEALNESERSFRDDIKRVTLLVLLAGLLIAGASVIRISWLERRFVDQHQQAQRTGEEMRSLSMRLRHAQEDERKSISRELHDDIGQKLTALRLELGTLERLRKAETSEFSETLADVKQLAEQCLRSIREMAAGLRPSVLDDLGIGPALQRQAREFSRHTGIPVAVDLSGEIDQLPEQHKVYIYRIVQESLTNCAKHARAKNIAVAVLGERDQVAVRVQDDGIGFDPKPAAQPGSGLIGIEERVRELGGTMEIESQAGNGTRLEVRIPLNGTER